MAERTVSVEDQSLTMHMVDIAADTGVFTVSFAASGQSDGRSEVLSATPLGGGDGFTVDNGCRSNNPYSTAFEMTARNAATSRLTVEGEMPDFKRRTRHCSTSHGSISSSALDKRSGKHAFTRLTVSLPDLRWLSAHGK